MLFKIFYIYTDFITRKGIIEFMIKIFEWHSFIIYYLSRSSCFFSSLNKYFIFLRKKFVKKNLIHRRVLKTCTSIFRDLSKFP